MKPQSTRWPWGRTLNQVFVFWQNRSELGKTSCVLTMHFWIIQSVHDTLGVPWVKLLLQLVQLIFIIQKGKSGLHYSWSAEHAYKCGLCLIISSHVFLSWRSFYITYSFIFLWANFQKFFFQSHLTLCETGDKTTASVKLWCWPLVFR